MKVAINGFGRIGRITSRALLAKKNVDLVAINDVTDIKTLAQLFRYDSLHGTFKGEVSHDDSHLIIDGKKIRVYAEKDPAKLPWKALGIDVVLESTGIFTEKEKAEAHIHAGARKVVISAPATGDLKTIVLGVNDNLLDGTETVVSNASCTTNCLAPMVKVLEDTFGIESGYMTTVHAYTADQRLQDSPHKDLRRARAAAVSIIPTGTGAAKALGLVIPAVKGKLNGYALRVPVPVGSVTDFTATLKRSVTKDEVNAAFEKASREGSLAGYLKYSTDPLVSADIVGDPSSCIFDSDLTMANGNSVKIVGWYDNEFGYSNRTADLIERIGQ
ncbi:type I glyceraldehyde-3-phosphate dehydrogenase [Chryseolinea lacunae]|uniref:Glyceraldehyde-3-phosphate dehydrogenase n=1 Tax=Chryseolinea lacunae TaxID=2801331 RepID=A0ABS1KN05_9BACT|nr:type I glyceraldehyde-3-phosphate dehydrogenase [Chryseolinea lacunae]MBL0740821.1 type I glyceraldehyde-3-phosphate dehydrogenase [Chryseolinea lacunae]